MCKLIFEEESVWKPHHYGFGCFFGVAHDQEEEVAIYLAIAP